jgi:ATP-dependent RNA helicase DDX42
MLQGDVGEANTDVTQIVKLLPVGGAKWNWLLNNVVQFMSSGSVLIFVTKKVRCKILTHILDKEFHVILVFIFYN